MIRMLPMATNRNNLRLPEGFRFFLSQSLALCDQRVGFADSVRNVVSKIKKGSVLTYKEVARKAGNPRASRAVGMILSKNYDPKIPCHRVVKSNGDFGGYNRGVEEKARRLREEGYFKFSNPK